MTISSFMTCKGKSDHTTITSSQLILTNSFLTRPRMIEYNRVMKTKTDRIIKGFLVAILAALGFASCSKPVDDPVYDDWSTTPGVYAYGTKPASFNQR